MRFFLAGIMQGSHRGMELHDQRYRERLRDALRAQFPGAEVYDPWADHQNSLDYDPDRARRVFLHHNRLCGEVDVVVAFVPEASMGTAVEMWEAWRHGRAVLTITPLAHNWAVRFCSHAIYPDLPAFERALAAGEVRRTIERVQAGEFLVNDSGDGSP